MSRRRITTILAIKSISAFYKVCSPSPNSFKTLALVRTLTTATERSYFQNQNKNQNGVNGGYPSDSPHDRNIDSAFSANYTQVQPNYNENRNPNSYVREFSQDKRNPSFDAHYADSSQQVQQNPNQYYTRNDGGSMQNRTNIYENYSNQNGYQTSFANGYQNGLMGSEEYPAEDCKNGELRGTVEELDNFCKQGNLEEAIKVLKLMEQQRVDIDLPRYFLLMKACGENKAEEDAKYVHEQLTRSLPYIEVSTNNKVLQMYWECGSAADAYKVFDSMPQKNLTSWDTMITGLAKNGFGEEAIDMFKDFKNSGLVPDGESFLGAFLACSAVLDVSEGLLHFESMKKDYNIEPSMNHYVSIVHMLGSTGYIDEAMEFIENMPIEPNVDIYETLMNLSRVHGNAAVGDRCAEFVELLDPTRLTNESRSGLIPVNPADLAKEKKKKNQLGSGLLGARSQVREYRAGDTSHPESAKLYMLLRGMKQQMKEVGYIPEVKFVLHDIDQESKEEALMSHSERLAIAQGLLTSPARADMRVIKNLRVCGDCHNALKIISKIVGRTLIMRDAKRFHHMKNGGCSCNDYW